MKETRLTDLTSKGHHINYPNPYKDDQGRWWFYDPEIGWECAESTNEKAKQINAIVAPILKEKIKGWIYLASTLEESISNDNFKELWDKTI